MGAPRGGRDGGSIVGKGGAVGHVRANWLKQQGFVKPTMPDGWFWLQDLGR
jgi:hypothetical protein